MLISYSAILLCYWKLYHVYILDVFLDKLRSQGYKGNRKLKHLLKTVRTTLTRKVNDLNKKWNNEVGGRLKNYYINFSCDKKFLKYFYNNLSNVIIWVATIL